MAMSHSDEILGNGKIHTAMVLDATDPDRDSVAVGGNGRSPDRLAVTVGWMVSRCLGATRWAVVGL